MIHPIVLFLKFAPSSEDFNRTFMDIDLIVPLWNRKKNKTSVDGQTFKSLWIQTLLKEPNFYYSRFEPEGSQCPGLGRGFFMLLPPLLRPPPR